GAGPEIALDRNLHRPAGAHPRRLALRRTDRRTRFQALASTAASTRPRTLSAAETSSAIITQASAGSAATDRKVLAGTSAAIIAAPSGGPAKAPSRATSTPMPTAEDSKCAGNR